MSEVVGIFITAKRAQPMVLRQSVRAVPGQGLEGDRHFDASPSTEHKPNREVTLIEAEQLEHLNRTSGTNLSPSDSRRNVVTRGVSLNDLVGKQFYVGDVLVCGIELCEPCAHLAKLTDARVLPGLVNRGGLRAQILTDGEIHVGDAIRAAAQV